MARRKSADAEPDDVTTEEEVTSEPEQSFAEKLTEATAELDTPVADDGGEGASTPPSPPGADQPEEPEGPSFLDHLQSLGFQDVRDEQDAPSG